MFDGLLIIDKPAGYTSAKLLNKLKPLMPRGQKIGHAGTLDPMATGVLIAMLGKATRLSQALMDHDKEYVAEVTLGATSDTDDAEGVVTATEAGVGAVTLEGVMGVMGRFVGRVVQMPPAYSALWVNGKRAYDLARKGEVPELKAREVMVHGLRVEGYAWPRLGLHVHCGKGFYVRSLARDIGAALGVGGYLSALRRTRVGECRVEDGVTLERLMGEGVGPFVRGV